MKPSVEGQFWMEGNAEFLAVKHAHDFFPRWTTGVQSQRHLGQSGGRMNTPGKPSSSADAAWEATSGLMGKSVCACGSVSDSRLWNIKTHVTTASKDSR